MLAMVRLAKEYGKGTLMINDIAESERIPKRFLESILLELKNNGYLGSRLGKKGGYYLVKHPKDVNLLEIVHFENVIMTLSKWQNEQIVSLEGKTIEIKDISKLKYISKIG